MITILIITTSIISSVASIGDEDPNEFIPYMYAMQGDVAFFRENGHYGLTDSQGRILHNAIFDEMIPFEYGLSVVSIKDISGVL